MIKKAKHVQRDHTLDTLLEMHGDIMEIGGGYWWKITATRVEPDDRRPYGIDYSLTLHKPSGERILGYDNAHPVKIGNNPGAKKKLKSDHRHKGKAIAGYPYKDAGALLEDFWTDVERILKKEGIQ